LAKEANEEDAKKTKLASDPMGSQEANEANAVEKTKVVKKEAEVTKTKVQAGTEPKPVKASGWFWKTEPEVETVKYGPNGCVSTYQNKAGHCVMVTDCANEKMHDYEYGLVCVDSVGSPVKHLFGKDSFDAKETFDSLIKCKECLGLEDIPDAVTLSGEVATMAKDMKSLNAVLANISMNVQMLNSKVFPAAAPAGAAPAPASAAAPAPASASADGDAKESKKEETKEDKTKAKKKGLLAHHHEVKKHHLRHSNKNHHRHHRTQQYDDDEDGDDSEEKDDEEYEKVEVEDRGFDDEDKEASGEDHDAQDTDE